MTPSVGSLVRCRGREWVVLPGGEPDLLRMRPLGGAAEEEIGVYLPIEPVEPATFGLPSPDDVGDYVSAGLLRDAVRLGFRSSAGPFRCFARIACDPRPYQLVPLMMALRLDPVRLLIADDVGIGKTVEALLIARELLDRGEAQRLAVLCPPHLAEQWQAEMASKFHIHAELILSRTVGRLESGLPHGRTVFEEFPFTIVSTDYIKARSRRDDFLRTCPELVIVDEAHTCAWSGAASGRGGRHFRHELLNGLAAADRRHLILVTATPHSGIEASFRSLLGLLDPQFADLPDDLSGDRNRGHRERLARHLVQRRRVDISSYLDADTPFPQRDPDQEKTYALSPEYRQLFTQVLDYVRERVRDDSGSVPRYRQRVRWWAALGLLRTMASSPAAAAVALRTKAAGLDAKDESDVDELGSHAVLDAMVDDETDIVDVIPGADAVEEEGALNEPERRRLRRLADAAERLFGAKDQKLQTLFATLKNLLSDGFTPIVFCRFVATAEYVAAQLRDALKKLDIECVTGLLAPEEREARVQDLSGRKLAGKQVILVATDCLSEGINLQEHFDAVVHYDLAWSPTRHEQRTGRVDRFGQTRSTVRSVMIYGIDNQIDGIVLEVLIRKHKKIRSRLGVSVPVPANSNAVVEALFEGLLLRDQPGSQLVFDQFMREAADNMHREWDEATEREERSRTLFAQHALKPDEVASELAAARSAVGDANVVQRFVDTAVTAFGGAIADQPNGRLYDLRRAPEVVRDLVARTTFTARYELPAPEGVDYLTRTSPVVEGLAAHVMDTALDPAVDSVARRCGVIYTDVVTRTTLFLLRLRYHIITRRRGERDNQLLTEDCRMIGFRGAPDRAEWLDPASDELEALLQAKPRRNIDRAQAGTFVQRVIDGFDHLRPHLDDYARRRGDEILDAHQRVRQSAKLTGVRFEIEPQLPVDVLGLYVFLPA